MPDTQQKGPASELPHAGPHPDWVTPEFGRIYQEHSQFIFYLALRLLGDQARAEDATHDVFLKAFRKMDTFRGDANVRTWLYRITINHCQNIQQSWHSRHMFSNADEAIWETANSDLADPLRVLETKELGQRIQRALECLTEEYRLLLLLVACCARPVRQAPPPIGPEPSPPTSQAASAPVTPEAPAAPGATALASPYPPLAGFEGAHG